MSGVNKVILLGHLGSDPEVRYTQGGQAVANFRMATSETWTDKDHRKQERTEWHRIVAWGKLGELAGEYLAKGRQVHVIGKLQTREWTDKENRKQWTTEIVAQELTFVGPKDGSSRRPEPPPQEERHSSPREQAQADRAARNEDPFPGDQDIPF